jgi:hypothetical protein
MRLLRKSIRVHLLWTKAGMIAAALAGGVVGVALLDYALGLPTGVRVLLWLAGAGTLAWAAHRWLLPAAKFSAPLSVLALRVEESEQGKRAGWQHKLAAALEIGEGNSSGAPALREAAIADLASSVQASKIQVAGLIERATAMKALAALAGAGAVCAGLFALSPSLASIGLARAITPWREISWPKRTGVVLAMDADVYARGSALPLRALLVRSEKPASRERITASVEVRVDGRVVSEQDVVLSHQATRASTNLASTNLASTNLAGSESARIEGDVFERLLDTQSLVPSGTPASARVEVRVVARSADDTTSERIVRLVEPPRIVAMDAEVTPPSYIASLLSQAHKDEQENQRASTLSKALVQGNIALVRPATQAQGNTSRGRGSVSTTLGPVLAGSRVKLTVRFEQAMPSEGASLASVAPGFAALASSMQPSPDAVEPNAIAAQTLTQDVPTLSVSGDAWTLEWTARESVRTALLPVGGDGIAAREETGLRVEVVGDASPSASVAQPASDESVLATAELDVQLVGRDDVAMHSVRGEVRKAAPSGTQAESPKTETARFALGETLATSDEGSDALLGQIALSTTLTLSEMGDVRVQPGDELWIVATSQDKAGLASGRAGVESSIRRLTIISESELVSQVGSEMAGLRDAAARLEQEQAKLSQQREQALQALQQNQGQDASSRQAQAAAQQALAQQASSQGALSQRTRTLQQRVQKLSERLERNRLDDAALRGLLEDANQTAQEATGASSEAQQALRTLSEQAQAGPAREASQAKAREAQEATQQALEELASTLDTKQDDWSVQRELERILTEQRQLRAQTQTASGRTQGQSAGELSREDKAELERLARKQDELSQRTRDGLAALDSRAQQLAEQSPEQAQTMSQAASEAREGQASNLQQQAARQLRENRTGQAQQAQADAERALERALRKLEDVQQARDEQLRRTLADLMQSLDALIASQTAAIAQLAPALAGEPKPTANELAQGMIALQRNTLGTIARLQSDERQARTLEAVIGNLQAASDAQGAAIVVLRAPQPDLGEADREERVSLDRLEDAKAEAQKLQEESEDRQQQRQREQLRERYEQMLQQHLATQTATKEIVTQEPTRRTRATARQLAMQQKLVRDGLAQIRSETEGLAEAKVFDFAHTRLDATLARVGAELEQGNATPAVATDQGTVTAILASLVEALRTDRQQNDELQEAGGGAGGGGGQQGGQQPLVPPLAELVLLRGMQAETNARTAQLEAAGNDAGDQAEIDAGKKQTAELQQQLADLAQQLLEALQQQQGNPMPMQNAAPGNADEKPEQSQPKEEP